MGGIYSPCGIWLDCHVSHFYFNLYMKIRKQYLLKIDYEKALAFKTAMVGQTFVV